jgi:hypothetical protein
VGVGDALGSNPLERLFDICHQPRFVLDGSYPGGGAGNEDGHDAVFEVVFRQYRFHMVRDVYDIALAVGFKTDGFGY